MILHQIILGLTASLGLLLIVEAVRALYSLGSRQFDWIASSLEFIWVFVSGYMLTQSNLSLQETILYASFVTYVVMGWIYGALLIAKHHYERKDVMDIPSWNYILSICFGVYLIIFSTLIMSGHL
ncbi:hypothetical protein [Hahella ganghwensis]|uniref:hypothetical protein n=1 Tax=Hahella ganghwensis TaxID=286420 RepID=UPI000380D9DB|nr:hypothetical protein [Hahella ganghwensis]